MKRQPFSPDSLLLEFSVNAFNYCLNMHDSSHKFKFHVNVKKRRPTHDTEKVPFLMIQ